MNCLNCFNILTAKKWKNPKYCNIFCQHEFQYKKNIEDWKSGSLSGYKGKNLQVTPWLRKYLQDSRGTQCCLCGWDDRHPDGAILTEIDHIDGDASNNSENNLRILCPNCHSKTLNFRNRNKNSKRQR
jgi:5-methylcytosine-specific restriction endonuclease McrA